MNARENHYDLIVLKCRERDYVFFFFFFKAKLLAGQLLLYVDSSGVWKSSLYNVLVPQLRSPELWLISDSLWHFLNDLLQY